MPRGAQASSFLHFVNWKSWNGQSQRIQGSREREGLPRMRAMFITWLTLIAAGLVLYSVIGLSHN
jgi:hypothetical protein